MRRKSWFNAVCLLIALTIAMACRNDKRTADLYALPALTEEGFNVVVEIPAGTNNKIEYQAETGKFLNDIQEGKNRIINFLPYPGNYGFIPSTYMDPSRGGDGDPLDVLVIGESQPTGAVIEALPIGVLLLRDRGELDSKIIAVPRDSSLRTMQVLNFKDFLTRYDPARRIVEDWFLNYKGYGVTELIRWEDDKYAWQEIQKWKREQK